MQKLILILLLLPLIIASCCKDNAQRTCGPNRQLVNDSCMCYPFYYDYDGTHCIPTGDPTVAKFTVVSNSCECYNFPFIMEIYSQNDMIMNTASQYNYEQFSNFSGNPTSHYFYTTAMIYDSCTNDTSTVVSTLLNFYGDYNQTQDTIRGYFQFQRIGHLGPEETRTCDIVLKRI